MNVREIYINSLDKFKKVASANLQYSDTLSDSKFTFDETSGTVTVLKSSTTASLGFRIPVPIIKKFDVVTFEYEHKYISGSPMKTLIVANGVAGYDFYTHDISGEWEKVTFSLVARYDGNDIRNTNYIEVGGLTTADVGSYQLRNIKITIQSEGSGSTDETITITNENGTAILFKDGSMIQYGSKTFTNVACTNPVGQLFYSKGELTTLGSFPRYFSSIDSVNITPIAIGDYCWSSIITQLTTSTLPQINCFKATSSTIANLRISWSAFGRWY